MKKIHLSNLGFNTNTNGLRSIEIPDRTTPKHITKTLTLNGIYITSVYDVDEVPNIVTVDTPFGKIGLSICADLLWKWPIVVLAEACL